MAVRKNMKTNTITFTNIQPCHDAAGRGLGYLMIRHIEAAAKKMVYKRIYLETHTNLKAAIHIYEKSGYELTERPKEVVHSTMNRFHLKQL